MIKVLLLLLMYYYIIDKIFNFLKDDGDDSYKFVCGLGKLN